MKLFLRSLLLAVLVFGAVPGLQAQVSASFTVSKRQACVGEVLGFTSTSTNASSLEWDFDTWVTGDTSTISTPSYTFTSYGMYVVSLIARDGTDADTAYMAINVMPDPHMLIFPDVTPGCPNSETTVSVYAAGNSLTWIWGDGDTTRSPVLNFNRHIYTSPGTYQVKVIAHGFCGDAVDSFDKVIAPGICPMGLYFTANANACLGTSSLLSLQPYVLLQPVDSLRWSTSDGQRGAGPDFVVNFNQIGSLTITVKGYRGAQVDSFRQTITVAVALRHVPYISVNSGGARKTKAPLEVTYQGDGIPFWYDFGDGPLLYTEASKVTHTYQNPGNYRIRIAAYSPCGNTVDTTSVSMVVSDAIPLDGFPSIPGTMCPGEEALLSLYGIDTAGLTWFIGADSVRGNHQPWQFAQGSYYVKYRVNNYAGGYFTDSMFVDVNPGNTNTTGGLYTYNTQSCTSSPITFYYQGDRADYIDFGDGTVLSNPVFPLEHTFTTEGHYAVMVLIRNKCGVASYRIRDMLITNDFMEQFSVSSFNGRACAGIESNFLLGSSDSVRVFFGDGTQADYSPAAGSLVHTYTSPGFFTVKAIKLEGCAIYGDTAYSTVYVSPAPRAIIDTATIPGTGSAVFFNASADAARSKWYFGDGDSSLLHTAPHFYSSNGTYEVKLITTNSFGCEHDTAFFITIEDNTGIWTSESLAAFRLYPNPAGGNAVLAYPVVGKHTSFIRIADLSGRELWQTQGDGSGKQVLPLEQLGLDAGIYLVHFEQGGERVIVKLAFQR